MDRNLQNFQQALIGLGITDSERAQALGVSARTFRRWIEGDLPEVIQNLMRYPQTLRGLAEDAEHQPAESVNA